MQPTSMIVSSVGNKVSYWPLSRAKPIRGWSQFWYLKCMNVSNWGDQRTSGPIWKLLVMVCVSSSGNPGNAAPLVSV